MDISNRAGKKYLPLIIISFSFVILLISSLEGYHGRNLEGGLDNLVIPGSWIVSKIGGKITDGYRFIKEFRSVWIENKRLKEETLLLSQKVSRISELELTNKRLRKLLAFYDKFPDPLLTSSVIGQDPSSWYQVVIINKGSKDKVTKDMVVITPQGLVGRIIKTDPNLSKVQLILDRNSGVGAMVQRTRGSGVVAGLSSNVCEFKYLAKNEDIQEDDIIITSGLGKVYPKGILIGKVTKVAKKSFGMDRYIEVTPSVDFSKMEEVFILKSSNSVIWPADERAGANLD